MYSFLTYSMMFLHTFVGLILIAIILLQRGRGGGLAGALGGMGGQSAFGNKAGDLFTRITVVLATIWIILGCVCVLLASNAGERSEKIDKGTFATEGADDKAAAGDKKDEQTAPAKSDSKTDVKPAGEKADAKADAVTDPKAAKPDETKPAATDKVDETKKDEKPAPADPKADAKDEGAKDAKLEVKEEKPADPVKKPEGEAAVEAKDSTEKKPE